MPLEHLLPQQAAPSAHPRRGCRRARALIPVLVAALLAPVVAFFAAAPVGAQDLVVSHGVRSYTSLIGNTLDRDAWTSGDIAFYAPPGAYTTENVTQWMSWYNRVDDLYEELSTDPNFQLVYRQNDPNFGRKKVLGVVNTCGVGCGAKSKAEADETFVGHFLEDPNDFVPHWIFFYEMARGGAPEPFFGRATWPANTVILPHLMAGVAFHDLGGDAGLDQGIPGHLLDRLEAWELDGQEWTEHFVESDEQAVGGYNSHDLIAAMFYRILMETDRQTVGEILQNMAYLPPSADAVSAMCDFQVAVNTATGDQFATRLVDDWGMPATCPTVTPVTAPPTIFNAGAYSYVESASAYDSFVMPAPGALSAGGDGWASDWEISTDPSDASYVPGNLANETYQVPVAGNQICSTPQTDSFRATRRLETPISSGDVWFSFNVRANNIGDGHLFVDLTSFGQGAVGKAWGRAFSIDNDRSGMDMATNRTYTVVVKHELNPAGADDIHLWVDPDLTDEPDVTDAIFSTNIEVGVVDQVGLNIQHHGGGDYCFDEMRFGYPVVSSTPTGPLASVDHSVTCLAGNGRVDTMIVNGGTERSIYRLNFGQLPTRQVEVDPGDWARIPITGRPDGDFAVIVERDGTQVSDTTIQVNCDSANPETTGVEVAVTSACRAGLGYVLFQFVNDTDTSAGYVIEFEGVANRSTTAAAFGQAVRAVTGRPSGTYAALIRRNGRSLTTMDVQVSC